MAKLSSLAAKNMKLFEQWLKLDSPKITFHEYRIKNWNT